MKRRFTKYPSNISASSNYEYANIYQIDFHNMIGDLLPLQCVCLYADSKEEARQLGKELAAVLGYKPDKIMVQYAYMTQNHLDTYYMPQNADGIEYFVRKGYVKASYYEAKAPGYAPNYDGQFFLEPWDLDEYPILQYDSEAEAREFADLHYDGRADIIWVDREHLKEYCDGEYDGEICN